MEVDWWERKKHAWKKNDACEELMDGVGKVTFEM